jgi:hypothetical protein
MADPRPASRLPGRAAAWNRAVRHGALRSPPGEHRQEIGHEADGLDDGGGAGRRLRKGRGRHGRRAAIFENPQHPYTKRLMAAVPEPEPEPERRPIRRGLSNDEIRSPVRASDHVPPARTDRDVSPGHVVQAWGEEWERA